MMDDGTCRRSRVKDNKKEKVEVGSESIKDTLIQLWGPRRRKRKGKGKRRRCRKGTRGGRGTLKGVDTMDKMYILICLYPCLVAV